MPAVVQRQGSSAKEPTQALPKSPAFGTTTASRGGLAVPETARLIRPGRVVAGHRDRRRLRAEARRAEAQRQCDGIARANDQRVKHDARELELGRRGDDARHTQRTRAAVVEGEVLVDEASQARIAEIAVVRDGGRQPRTAWHAGRRQVDGGRSRIVAQDADGCGLGDDACRDVAHRESHMLACLDDERRAGAWRARRIRSIPSGAARS